MSGDVVFYLAQHVQNAMRPKCGQQAFHVVPMQAVVNRILSKTLRRERFRKDIMGPTEREGKKRHLCDDANVPVEKLIEAVAASARPAKNLSEMYVRQRELSDELPEPLFVRSERFWRHVRGDD